MAGTKACFACPQNMSEVIAPYTPPRLGEFRYVPLPLKNKTTEIYEDGKLVKRIIE